MSDDTEEHRSHFQASGDAISVREGEGDGDGLFRVRMPVSSTAEARDGEAFTRDRIEGFRDQIASGDVGVFLDHGRNETTGSRYSALGKVGYWDTADIVERDGAADLVADAVLMDPAELEADVGDLRAALATLKAQAEVGIPLASSVGWSEDTGERDVPGGADLLEISIVGIPSDPRTTTASAEPAAMARAVSAATSDFDVDAFAETYRDVVGDTNETHMSDSDEPDEQSGTDDEREEPSLRDMEAKMEEVRKRTERMESMQEEMYEEMMGGDDENADDGAEDDEEDEDDEMEEDSADAGEDEERTITVDGEERSVDDVRDELTTLREQASEAEPETPETEDRAEEGDADDEADSERDDDSDTTGFGFAGAAE